MPRAHSEKTTSAHGHPVAAVQADPEDRGTEQGGHDQVGRHDRLRQEQWEETGGHRSGAEPDHHQGCPDDELACLEGVDGGGDRGAALAGELIRLVGVAGRDRRLAGAEGSQDGRDAVRHGGSAREKDADQEHPDTLFLARMAAYTMQLLCSEF